MESTLVIVKVILRLPVMILSITFGIPLAFLKSVWIGSNEVSDTLVDMVFSVEEINRIEEEKRKQYTDVEL